MHNAENVSKHTHVKAKGNKKPAMVVYTFDKLPKTLANETNKELHKPWSET
jgi:hypothetical protein